MQSYETRSAAKNIESKGSDSAILSTVSAASSLSTAACNQQLIQAAENNDIKIAEKALKDGADINFTDEESGNTALHIAAQNNNAALVKLLLDTNANTNIPNLAFEFPLQSATKNSAIFAAVTNAPASKIEPVLHQLLRERTTVDINALKRLQVFCREQYIIDEKDAKDHAANTALLDFAVSYLTGMNIAAFYKNKEAKENNVPDNKQAKHKLLAANDVSDHSLRNQNNWLRFIMHLKDIAAKYQEVNLEGWQQEEFLVFRIRCLWEILLHIELGLIKLPAEFNNIQLINKLYTELVTQVESAQICQSILVIRKATSTYEQLIESLAQSIIRKLDTLPEYSFPGGWVSHSIFINFLRNKGKDWAIRIDNLGRGVDDSNYHAVTGSENQNYYPCVLGPVSNEQLESVVKPYLIELIRTLLLYSSKPKIESFVKERGKINKEMITAFDDLHKTGEYLFGTDEQQLKVLKEKVNILDTHIHKKIEYNYKISAETKRANSQAEIALNHIYAKSRIHFPNLKYSREMSLFYPPAPAQNAGTCVVASHNIGLRIRLGENFYHWILTQEWQVLGRLADQYPQVDCKDFYNKYKQPRGLPRFVVNRLMEHNLVRIANKLSCDKDNEDSLLYIPLEIIEEKQPERNKNEATDSKKGEKEQTESQVDAKNHIVFKNVIKFDEIFQLQGNSSQRILVLGQAGVGKTTLCQYIRQQWSRRILWSNPMQSTYFDYIFHIPLRNLNTKNYGVQSNYTDIDLIRHEYFSKGNQVPWTTALEEDIKKVLQENKQRILWLLDGYDELPSTLPNHVWQRLVKKPYCLVTSRSNMVPVGLDRQLQIIGFSKDSILAYVDNFFSKPSISKVDEKKSGEGIPAQYELVTFLKTNPNIWNVAHIPVNLSLICNLWRNSVVRSSLKQATGQLTITILYQKMLLEMLRRFLEKRGQDKHFLSDEQIYTQCDKYLGVLGDVAFQLMKKQDYTLTHQEFAEITKKAASVPQLRVDLKDIGILQNDLVDINILISPVDDKIQPSNYWFIHPTFQEFLTANYLVKRLQDDKSEPFKEALNFICARKYDLRMINTWAFIAGLANTHDTKEVSLSSQRFWAALQEMPYDLVGIRHQQLVITCLEEIIHPIPEQKKHLRQIRLNFRRAALAEDNIDLHTLYEKQWIVSLLRRSPRVIMQSGIYEDIYTVAIGGIKEYARRKELAASSQGNQQVVYSPQTAEKKMRILNILAQLGSIVATPEMIIWLQEELLRREEFCEADHFREPCSFDPVTFKFVPTGRKMYLLLPPFKNMDVIKGAIKALGSMEAIGATPKIVDSLLELFSYFGKDVVRSLEQIGVIATPKILSLILNALNNEHLDTSFAIKVMKALSQIKTINIETMEIFQKGLQLKREDAVYISAQVLGRMADKDIYIVDTLLRVLTDNSSLVRLSVAKALGKLSLTNAKIPIVKNALKKTLNDKDKSIRIGAALALSKLNPDDAISQVINVLKDALLTADSFYHHVAIQEVDGEEKEFTATIVSTLLRLYALKRQDSEGLTYNLTASLEGLKSNNWKVKHRAILALSVIGAIIPSLEVVINALLMAVNPLLPDVQQSASDDDNLQTVQKSELPYHDLRIRSDIILALSKIGAATKNTECIQKIVPIMLRALRSDDSWINSEAAVALGKMSSLSASAEAIIKTLFDIASDDSNDEDLVRSAAMTLSTINRSSFTQKMLGKLYEYWPNSSDIDYKLCIKDLLMAIPLTETLKYCFSGDLTKRLPIFAECALLQEVAITIDEYKIIIWNTQKTYSIKINDTVSLTHLIQAFAAQAKSHGLSIEIYDQIRESIMRIPTNKQRTKINLHDHKINAKRSRENLSSTNTNDKNTSKKSKADNKTLSAESKQIQLNHKEEQSPRSKVLANHMHWRLQMIESSLQATNTATAMNSEILQESSQVQAQIHDRLQELKTQNSLITCTIS